MVRFILTGPLALLILLANGPFSWSAPMERIDHRLKENRTVEDLIRTESEILDQLNQTPRSDELTWRLARTYYLLGTRTQGDDKTRYFNRCIEQGERTVAINPGSAMGFFLRGVCRGKYGETRGIWNSLTIISPFKEDMNAALAIDPSVDFGGPHRGLGRLYFELPFFLGGDIKRSIAHLEEAVRLGPEFGENHLFLAEAYIENDELERARQSLLKCMEVTRSSRNDPDIQALRSRCRELLDSITPLLNSMETDALANKNN